MKNFLHSRKSYNCVIALITCSILLLACGAARTPPPTWTVVPTTVPPSPTPEPTANPAVIAAGKEAFVRVGCVACHTIKGLSTSLVAPDLDQAYKLASDSIKSPEYKKSQGKAKTPRDFLIESILYPDAFTYPMCPQGPCVKGTMPANYKDIIRPEELNSIVEFLLSLGR
jgi:Cytochrome c